MSHQFLPTGDNLSLMMIILEVIVIIQVSKSGLLHCNFWTHLCIYMTTKKSTRLCTWGNYYLLTHSYYLVCLAVK